MKKLFFLTIVSVVLFGFTFGKYVDDKTQALLKQFQVSEDAAMNTIFSNISGPSFYIPNIKILKAMASGERAAMVETIGRYVKDFTNSQEFTKRYNEYRENKKPTPPEIPQTGAEVQKKTVADMKKSIESMETQMKQMPADQKQMFEDIIRQQKEQLTEYEKPDNPMFGKNYDDAMQQSYQYQLDDYNKRYKEWETNYPEGKPGFLVKEWLNDYMEKSNAIDFNAQLATNNYGKQVFTKAEYERKDYLWKLLFRAGRESVDASRKFAQSWLSELK
jgi:hypothetical protein